MFFELQWVLGPVLYMSGMIENYMDAKRKTPFLPFLPSLPSLHSLSYLASLPLPPLTKHKYRRPAPLPRPLLYGDQNNLTFSFLWDDSDLSGWNDSSFFA